VVENTKIAFKFDESGDVYYSPVDNFIKPGNTIWYRFKTGSIWN